MATAKDLYYFDQANRVPVPQTAASPFNNDFQDIWIGFDTTTGELCIANYNRTEIISCFAAGEKFVKIDLTAAQIQNLFSNPVVAIPAAGAGKIIRVTWGAVRYKYNGTAFTNTAGLLMKFPSSTGVVNLIASAPANIFSSPQDSFHQVILNNSTLSNLYENEPLELTTGANSLVGDGTAEVWIYYKIMELPAS